MTNIITQNLNIISIILSIIILWVIFKLLFKGFIDGVTIPWVNDYKYGIKKYFFSYNEVEFYTNLRKILYKNYGFKYEVYPKVRLSDILGPEKGYNRYKRLQTRHIDFLIVDKDQIFKPILAIELGGDFHKQYGQYKSDKFKNKVFKNSNLPLIIFNDSSSTNEETIEINIKKHLGATTQ